MKAPTLRRSFMLGISAILSFTLIVVSCRKNLKEAEYPSVAFDDKAAKEWYYGSFKKSAEFKSAKESGKKLPDWKHGIRRNVSGMEIVEFPLIKNYLSVPVVKTKGSRESDYLQIARSTLSRIVFIRKTDGTTYVREILYIPSKEYLAANKYDISNVHLGINNSGGFTGRIVIKKWESEIVSVRLLENGKIKGISRKILSSTAQSTSAREDCEPFEICEYERFCYPVYMGDTYIGDECSEWKPTGFCWTELICTTEDECDYSQSENCECQLFGLGCEEEEEDEEDDEEETCNYSIEQAKELLETVTAESVYVVSTETNGSETSNAAGVIQRPSTKRWHFYTGTLLFGQTIDYSVFFLGYNLKKVNPPLNGNGNRSIIQTHGKPVVQLPHVCLMTSQLRQSLQRLTQIKELLEPH